MSTLGDNDLGVPAVAHYEIYWFNCGHNQPGDWSVEEVDEVTCPECLKKFEEMRNQRRKLLSL